MNYFSAAKILREHGIPFVTHIMIGLPGEGDAELCETVDAVNRSDSWGIKIHSVYVSRGTKLEAMYRNKEYVPIEINTYVRRAAYVLTHVKPDTVVHRITGDCPKDMLVAPLWNLNKNEVIAKIRDELQRLGQRQGSEYCK